MASVKSLETEVALVKNDVAQMSALFTKLELTLDKITDVSNNVSQILAVHASRLSTAEEETEHLQSQIEEHRREHQADIRELHSRLTTSSREIREEMGKDIDKVLTSIENLRQDIKDKSKEQDERIASLEKWRWIIVGGLILMGGLAPFVLEMVFHST